MFFPLTRVSSTVLRGVKNHTLPLTRVSERVSERISSLTLVSTPVASFSSTPSPASTPEDLIFESSFLQTLQTRGYLHQCTDYNALDKKLNIKEGEKPIAAYLGFDATAKSLHVGSLVQIMLLRHLQKCGHKPIILVGGGTTKVGDPSGKDESRSMLSDEDIQDNIDHITRIFEKYLSIGDGPTDAVIVNNAEWLDSINYLEFLRNYGPFFTINRMLSFESVKQRLDREQPLTFLEFNYMLLQAYDFLELYRSPYKVQVQIGGSDQWGNIINGIELARKCQKVQLYGITAPLITNSAGKKMGKSASGAVWLDKDLLSEFEYWQFWRNTPDSDVERFLYLFTELPAADIKKLMAENGGAALNGVKVILADEVTRLLHGDDCLTAIHQTARSLFESSSGEGGLDSLERVTIKLSDSNMIDGMNSISIVDILLSCKFASSKADAKRQIIAGSIRIDNEKCTNPKAMYDLKAGKEGGITTNGRQMKVSSGKKKHVVVVVEAL